LTYENRVTPFLRGLKDAGVARANTLLAAGRAKIVRKPGVQA